MGVGDDADVKLVPNPEFAEAPYVLAFIYADGTRRDVPGFQDLRTNKIPPKLETFRELMAWFVANEVPSHIAVEET